MVVVGVPPEPTPVAAFSLIGGNKRLAGSLIGGIANRIVKNLLNELFGAKRRPSTPLASWPYPMVGYVNQSRITRSISFTASW